METIYKGAKWEMTIDSDTQLDTTACRLYNPSTRSYIQFTTTLNGSTDSVYHYTLTLAATDTDSAAAGVYHLECFAPSDGEMVYHQDNFARVITTSKSTN